MSPKIIIVGAQKCGTTSMYEALVSLPNEVPSSMKELHFFNLNFDKGFAWYIANVGSVDASPFYCMEEKTIHRMKNFLPEVEIMFMYRDPAERAISHWLHERRKGREHLSLIKALLSEKGRTRSCAECFRWKSYLERGRYERQLTRLLHYYEGRVTLVHTRTLIREPFCFRYVASELGFTCDRDSVFGKHNVAPSYSGVHFYHYALLRLLFAGWSVNMNEFIRKNYKRFRMVVA